LMPPKPQRTKKQLPRLIHWHARPCTRASSIADLEIQGFEVRVWEFAGVVIWVRFLVCSAG
jgi:hypothetical protein